MRAARIGCALLLLAVVPPAAAQQPPAGSRGEPFEEFFTRFRQDTSFQLSRIRFPLPRFSQADDAEQVEDLSM